MSLDNEESLKIKAEADQTKALQDGFTKFRSTGIVTKKADAELLAEFRQGRDIVIDSGTALVNYDGELLPLDVALTRWSFDASEGEVDRRTLPRTGITARAAIASKQDLDTVEKKVAYIAENGAHAFEQLPRVPVSTAPLEYKSQWFKLSREEKVRRTHEDPEAFVKLKDDPSAHGAGIRYQAPSLDAELRKNPNLRLPGWSGRALTKAS